MEDKAWDLFLVALSAALGAVLSRVPVPKKKTPKPSGKHFKRS